MIFPRVKVGGIVTPNGFVEPLSVGEEKCDDQRRSATRSRERSPGREGPAGGKRPTGRSGPPRQAAPLISSSLKEHYVEEFEEVRRVYPGAKIWTQSDGLWLLTESALLPGLRKAAIFLVGISCDRSIVRGWGFWQHSFVGVTWIGPRHTNFPDGSICAFHEADGTWVVGDPLVELLDLYTLWALRHLHLELFGRWPGLQVVTHPYERILELRVDEFCGCGRSRNLYGHCCRDKDIARNRIADAVNFVMGFAGGLREPPHAIMHSVHKRTEPPPIKKLLMVPMICPSLV